MKTAGAKEAGTYRTVPVWIKLLVGLHVFAVTVWALPQPADAVRAGRVQPAGTGWLLFWNSRYLKELRPVQAYVLSTGTWQYWDMFAPDPSNTDWYCAADVTYKDGTTKAVPYPRMNDLPIPMKYVKERYRKFFERAHNRDLSAMWPPFAQTMAHLGYTDPNNPPMVVRLKALSLRIADPGQRQSTKYDVEEYFDYAVDQAQLRRLGVNR